MDDSTNSSEDFPNTRRSVDHLHIDDNQLAVFILLKNERAIERTIAVHWIHWYLESKYSATAALFQVFVSALGYDYKIQIPEDETFIQRHLSSTINDLERLYKNDQPYLLGDAKRGLFKEKYCNMLKKIVIIGRDQVILDSFFMEIMIYFLDLLSKSFIKNHRILSVITALSIYTPMTRIRYNLLNMETSELETLGLRMNKIYEIIIKPNMKSIETKDILKLYILSIKRWFIYDKFSLTYCKVSNLKFILRTTYARDKNVRATALILLKHIYQLCSKSQNAQETELKKFTKDKADKIIRLCFRRGSNIRSYGIEITKLSYAMFPDSFSQKQLQSVFKLVFHLHQKVARAAGSLFWFYITQEYDIFYIQYLILFLLEHKNVDRDTDLFVDAIWSEISTKDYRKMVDLLIEMLNYSYDIRDFISREAVEMLKVEFSEQAKITLIETLLEIHLQYIREASTGQCLRHTLKMKEFTELDLLEIRLKMDLVTETLYDIICPIIERMFQVNSKCVMMVLEIPQYFNYMLYKNNVSFLEDLVSLLSRILNEQTDEHILQVCLKTINILRDSEICDVFPIIRLLDDDILYIMNDSI
ncbi:uncharacterized protein LOC113374454, partial [Ctenocephalides felis]|uniref:uncharacterized protein LOC113374454 n=1 Tax=Ctenocephalides felis TaxID=7515 RepID=UPI000E6E5770